MLMAATISQPPASMTAPLTTAISEMINAWNKLQRMSRYRLTKLMACRNCRDYDKCGAGCMGRAYAAHGDFLSVEDRCQLRKVVYRRNFAV